MQELPTNYNKEAIQGFIDLSATLIVYINLDQTVAMINRKACLVLGYEKDYILKKNWFDYFIPSPNREQLKSYFKEMIEGKSSMFESFENQIKTKDNQEIWVTWQNNLIKDNQGRITGILSSGIDITDRKSIESHLKRRIIFERMLSDISNQALEEEETHKFIPYCLKTLRETLELTKVKLIILESNSHAICQKFEYPQPMKLNEAAGKDLDISSFYNQLAKDKAILIHINDDSLSTRLKDFLLQNEISTLLILPLTIHNRFQGYLLLEENKHHQTWQQEDIFIIKTLCNTISTSIEREEVRKSVEKSEKLYRTLFETANDMIFLTQVDENGLPSNIIKANQQACNKLRYGSSEYQKISFLHLLRKKDRESLHNQIKKLLSSGNIILEASLKGKKNTWLPVEINIHLFMLEDELAVFCIARDVSERKKNQKAIVESEKKYRLLFNSINDAIFVYRLVQGETLGEFIEVNDIACQYLGYSKDELLDLNPLVIDLPMDADISPKLYETVHTTKRGDKIPVEISSRAFHYKGDYTYISFISIVRDISKHNLLKEKLRSMAFELSISEEKERRRIAEFLHDNIGQYLSLSKIKLENLKLEEPDNPHLQKLDEIINVINNSILFTRSLTAELRPPILYEVGLEPAIEWLAENLEKDTNIKFNVTYEFITSALAVELRSILFNAVRELLVNVIKHSRAKECHIDIKRENNEIFIEIHDNGKGFKVKDLEKKLEKQGGFGLFNIKERLKYLDGIFSIDSIINKGTKAYIKVPIKTENDI